MQTMTRTSATHRAARAGASALASACLLTAGCTGRVSIEPRPGPQDDGAALCRTDASVDCLAGIGWSCSAGAAPGDSISNLSCSAPTIDGPFDDFCCFEWTFGSSCTPDDALTTACQPRTFGYRCQAGDDPNSLDSALSCSVPTPDGSDDVFCCR
jgi:hypothetical protein